MAQNQTSPHISKSHFKNLSLKRLLLTDFRNYQQLDLQLTNAPVVISGKNGAGKTNILEAVSLLSPGRGLRKAKLKELGRHVEGNSKAWSLYYELQSDEDDFSIGTALEQKAKSPLSDQRLVKINHTTTDQKDLLDYLSLFWITPEQDRLFVGQKADRRQFFDQIIGNFDPEHRQRLQSYEKLMRQRMQLLYQSSRDETWIATIEQQMAELATSLSMTRQSVTESLNDYSQYIDWQKIKAEIIHICEIQKLFKEKTALEVEELIKQRLKENRNWDRESGMTHFGPHRNDWNVQYLSKSLPASHCSMGEQKLLLMWVMLCAIVTYMYLYEEKPLFLVDEVTAHLDITYREMLLSYLKELQIQFWLTGTESELFAPLKGYAQFLHVEENKVRSEN